MRPACFVVGPAFPGFFLGIGYRFLPCLSFMALRSSAWRFSISSGDSSSGLFFSSAIGGLLSMRSYRPGRSTDSVPWVFSSGRIGCRSSFTLPSLARFLVGVRCLSSCCCVSATVLWADFSRMTDRVAPGCSGLTLPPCRRFLPASSAAGGRAVRALAGGWLFGWAAGAERRKERTTRPPAGSAELRRIREFTAGVQPGICGPSLRQHSPAGQRSWAAASGSCPSCLRPFGDFFGVW